MIKDILTGKDNTTHDIARWGFVLALFGYLYFTFLLVSKDPLKFDMQAFGIGFGALAAGTGGMIKFKERSEPDVVDDTVAK